MTGHGEVSVIGQHKGMATDLVSSFLDRYRLAAVIQAVEEDLRAFIRNYIAPYVEAETLFGERYDELRKRAADDGVLDPTMETLIDYIDFGEAFGTLNRHRGMIPEDLATVVKAVTPAFETAAPIRNRVMHGRPLQSGDEEHIARLGQTLTDTDVSFAVTQHVVARLVEEPDWVPFVDIASASYGEILHNLPLPEYDETGLLGREQELRELKRRLIQPRFPVVTIAGEGGIGKTALAVQVLYDIVDDKDLPYEAVLWVTLKTERLTGKGVEQLRDAALDFLSITGELSSAIGGTQSTDIELLANVLEGTRTLVAIDNIESISGEEIRALIEALPECQFLLTSRVGLGEMEVRIPLGALGDQAAKVMFRQLARRRGLMQLAKVSDAQATTIVTKLRRSPLGIRWFVEAVEIGGQPDELLRDQAAVLQFCMSTIYDALTPEAHRVVECLLAVDRPGTIGEIALLTDLERDEVQEQIYELQRRSLVAVDTRLSVTLAQSYALSEMAREHLQRFGSVDPLFGEQVRSRLRQIGAAEEVMRSYDNRIALEPAAIVAENDEELAVAHGLRRALGRSRTGDLSSARDLVAKALNAVPGYFESYRVSAFLESDARPEEARRLYEEAYRLAPDDQKPRVAYWMAGHLMKNTLATEEAAAYAEQAHEGLGLPGTALRLGRIRMYQQRFDEAHDLVTSAADIAAGKSRLMAETDLLDLAKRRVEHLAGEQRKPGLALDVIPNSLERANRVLEEGFSDRRFNDGLIELLAEGLFVSLRTQDLAEISPKIVPILEALDSHFGIAANPRRRSLWEGRVSLLAEHDELEQDLRAYAAKILKRLELHTAKSGKGLQAGEVDNYQTDKKFGFIRTADGDRTFFHRNGLVDARDSMFIVRGVEVVFRMRAVIHEGKAGTRAEEVSVTLTPAQRERALRSRRGIVVKREERFLFIQDSMSGESFFAHRTAFRDRTDWQRANVGAVVTFDVEFAPQGVKAAAGSAVIEQLRT
jgi:cold shock CspA family protein/tetratricopeptide (TPR) repeat protein